MGQVSWDDGLSWYLRRVRTGLAPLLMEVCGETKWLRPWVFQDKSVTSYRYKYIKWCERRCVFPACHVFFSVKNRQSRLSKDQALEWRRGSISIKINTKIYYFLLHHSRISRGHTPDTFIMSLQCLSLHFSLLFLRLRQLDPSFHYAIRHGHHHHHPCFSVPQPPRALTISTK